MADIPTAEVFQDVMDPHEKLDHTIELNDILEADEEIDPAEWTLIALPEAVALGLTIMTGDGRDPALTDDSKGINLWLSIDDLLQDDPAFDGAGTQLPMRVHNRTTSSPYRERERTFKVKVAQL